jgi:hypothetical protein
MDERIARVKKIAEYIKEKCDNGYKYKILNIADAGFVTPFVMRILKDKYEPYMPNFMNPFPVYGDDKINAYKRKGWEIAPSMEWVDEDK